MLYNKNITLLSTEDRDDMLVEHLRVTFDNFADAQAWAEERMAHHGFEEIVFNVKDGQLVHEFTNNIEIAALMAEREGHEAALALDMYDARCPWH